MIIYYLDTSALVKLFVQETGSDWVESIVLERDEDNKPRHLFVFSKTAIVEFSSAIARRTRSGQITSPVQQELLDDFQARLQEDFMPVAIRDEIIWTAAALIRKHPLRAYDAIHLATALSFRQNLRVETKHFVFLSADETLLSIAKAEKLSTDNPNLH